MSFKSAEWEKDEVGDQIHAELFRKGQKIKKAKKRKTLQSTSTGSKETSLKLSLSNNIAKNLQKILSTSAEETNIDEKPTKPKRKLVKIKKKITRMKIAEKSPRIKKRLKRLENKKTVEEVKQPNVVGLNIANLKKRLAASLEGAEKSESSLRDRMMDKLSSARFRYLNEQMYTSKGSEAQKLFEEDPGAFEAYHEGYRQQLDKWPLNPLDIIIAAIQKMPAEYVVGDFGCGEARLSQSVPQKVHSFDLVASKAAVVRCDMARVPLGSASLDVAVYCLSLMGTNLKDYLLEANRLLKIGGILKIAEVESRFEGVEAFIQMLQKCGFKSTGQDLSRDLFYFLDFVKERNIKHKNKIPAFSLRPCLYKKR